MPAAAAWFAQLLDQDLRPWLTLTPLQINLLYDHYLLLEHWNKRINLTSIKPGPEMVIRHYCESLFFGAHLPSGPASIADIGSGAGFPGVPMAILRADWQVSLIESNQRKAVFLREASRNLRNVNVIAQRAENLSVTFDWIVSRAVKPEDVLEAVPRMAPKVGLMLGEDDFSQIRGRKHIAWAEPIRVPWGDRRICVFGERVVSRGT